ncbi:MAG TPA: hypothetical protein DD670_15825 [Planctomycetaceae bacterium]|nr:hypothetical protein [Planctomycetaceae bacterium]
MGFGLIEYDQHKLVAHSIFVEHLRPAGFLGLLFVGIFFWPLARIMMKRQVPPGVTVLCAALVGTLAYGVAHSTHNMLVGWIVIGLLYQLSANMGNAGASHPLLTVPGTIQGRPGKPPVFRRT